VVAPHGHSCVRSRGGCVLPVRPRRDATPSFPSGQKSQAVVETLLDYTKAHPEQANAVEGFTGKHGFKVGRKVGDNIDYLFLSPSDLFCSVTIYEHGGAVAKFLTSHRSADTGVPTPDEAIQFLEDSKIPRQDPDGYTCLASSTDKSPRISEVVGWEYTTRARILGHGQKVAVLLAIIGIGAFVTMNLYYRGLVFIICGPRQRQSHSA
jgi:hypothetical protein